MLIYKYIECSEKSICLIIGAFVSIIGFVLSVLWLWMAKGSKAWYEVYENAIWEMESLNNDVKLEGKYLIHNFWALKTEKDFSTKTKEEKMFATRAFSPSKIVIAIGWLLITFWVCALLFCLLVYFQIEPLNLIFVVIFGGGLILCLFKYGATKIESSTLRDFSAQELFKKITNDNEIQKLKLYFEVQEDEVCFFTQDNAIEQQLSSLYKTIPLRYYSNKIAYDFNVIDNHYKESIDDDKQIMTIRKQFRQNDIEPIDVKMFENKTIYVYFEGSNYEKDNAKIAKVVEKLMKDYTSIKVNYELK